MDKNTERFTGRADLYDRYRMRYPADAILQTLREMCGLTPDFVVADIGAGTGMLSEVFLENGNTVFAVEPNDEMRDAAVALTQRYPKLTIIDAAAEATTLPDAAFDVVAAGRAFHWFDRERAMQEFERIAKPCGWLVLVSASRNKQATEANRAAEALLTSLSVDRERLGGGHHFHENAAAVFEGREVLQRRIESEALLTREAWVGQTLSFSSAPLPGTSDHVSFVRTLNKLFDEHAENNLIRVPEICWITCVRLRG